MMVPSAPPLPDRLLDSSYLTPSQSVTYRSHKKGDPEYGRPPKGSRTEQRGLAAQAHIQQEVKYLCEIIHTMGKKLEDSSNEVFEITFKQLFDFYANVSNKLVGILLRARKHGYIHFPEEYEALFQGRHDHVKIKLLRMPPD